MRYSIILVAFLTIPTFANSDTIIVPDDYPTIQEAIDAAVNGDTVLVKPGTYVENINFKGKAITVTSEQRPDVTIIDGNQAGSVVTFRNGEKSDSILEGFQITRGFSNEGGGGILCQYCSPTITNNIITDNTGTNGGGIKCTSADASIIGNVIVHNLATSSGGGIDCGSGFSPSPTIVNNIIAYNTAQSWEGGGIYVHGEGMSPVIINNTIVGNDSYGNGGGLRMTIHSPVCNNIVWGNKPDQIHGYGGVTYCDVQGGWPGTGNINADPLLFDPGNEDFHLQQAPCQPGITNPCVDAGDPGSPMIEGSTRTDSIQDAGVVDMGFHYPAKLPFDYLNAGTYTLSAAKGGTVYFYLSAGAGNAKRDYILLGSLSGTEPGLGLPGGFETLPLNWDLFTDLIIYYLNSSFFMNFLGILDPDGNGAAILNTLGPLPQGMAGMTLSFAYALNNPWDFVSNPVNIEIIP